MSGDFHGLTQKHGIDDRRPIHGLRDRVPKFVALQPGPFAGRLRRRVEVEPQHVRRDRHAGPVQSDLTARRERLEIREILKTDAVRHEIGGASLQPQHFGVLVGRELQFELIQGYGDDSAEIQKSNGGVPTVCLLVPVRYTHAHNGIMNRRDFDQMVDLVVELLQRLDAKAVQAIRDFTP